MPETLTKMQTNATIPYGPRARGILMHAHIYQAADCPGKTCAPSC